MDTLPMSRVDLAPDQLSDDVVALRHWTPEDIEPLVAALQDREISHWIPVIPWPYGRDEGRSFVDFANHDRAEETGAHLAVTDRSSGALLGSVALTRLSWGNLSAELGYWTSKEARGRGVATKASQLIVDWALSELQLQRLELICHPDNAPSQRVAEKLGFQLEGCIRGHMRVGDERRDSLLYGLLPSDLP